MLVTTKSMRLMLMFVRRLKAHLGALAVAKHRLEARHACHERRRGHRSRRRDSRGCPCHPAPPWAREARPLAGATPRRRGPLPLVSLAAMLGAGPGVGGCLQAGEPGRGGNFLNDGILLPEVETKAVRKA